ncbi:thymidine phosphorylase [Nevskia sp.]|uniref:thymidine phosphorylase n=1 Tax=Nevskia sp. TaxID=1929292 RepID=UPI0025EDB1CF|nr:thymidine phosphorylase [Nevskia sp.]
MTAAAEFLVVELLHKKRDGHELSDQEISFLVRGFSDGSIPDYQVSAWLMAGYLKGFSRRETLFLTRSVKESGRSFDWRSLNSNFKGAVFADKHSSGGVGDKVSLVLAPVAACLGLKVPMMSGRGLGHTGGTVDKLEAIPGFSMQPTERQMIEWLDHTGVCLTAQSADLCPADRKLYSLRDVTATIDSVPLITASIVSKKWAEGVDVVVYDVKCGEAAFMTNLAQARALGSSLVDATSGAGIRTLACISRMDEPLGSMIGNANEVEECLWMMRNDYPSANHRRLAAPLLALSLRLAAEMAVLGGTRSSIEQAQADARAAIESGQALAVFMAIARNQGAVPGWETRLPQPEVKHAVTATRAGRISHIHARQLGLDGIRLGAGRATAESRIDPAVGIEMAVRPGDTVARGDVLLYLHLRAGQHLEVNLERIFGFDADAEPPAPELLLERIST